MPTYEYTCNDCEKPFEKRASMWCFEQLGIRRRKLLQRAGPLTRPRGKLTLTMSANATIKSELLHYMEVLNQAA